MTFQYSMNTIERRELIGRVEDGLRRYPVTALQGPRQCGKTTLAREVARSRSGSFFDLENPRDLARLETPQRVFESLRGLVVLDEIQRKPDLLPLLRVLSDEKPLR